MTAALFAVDRGIGDPPIVLLHGFGGSHAAWDRIVARIGGERRTIAFDLPGHALSLDQPHGSAAKAARSVLAALAARGVMRAHLVGHSFGGAAASLAALMQPGLAASLTLLSPGGFGPDADQALLRAFASAREEVGIARALEGFFAEGSADPAMLSVEQAEQRRTPGAIEALATIVDTFFEGDRQKVLPVSDLGRLDIPVAVLWGSDDRVLPAKTAEALPKTIAVHIASGAGHMLPYEAPDAAARLILETIARAE